MIFQKRAQDERGLALITVVVASTVMMLLVATLVRVGVQLVEHLAPRPGLERRAGAARGGHRRLHLPPQRELELLAVQRDEPAARQQPNRVHELGRRRRRPRRRPRSTATASTLPRSASTAASRSPRRAASATRERTVYATLRRRSFLDYLYFTDYRDQGPGAVHRFAVHRCARRRTAAPPSTTTAARARSATSTAGPTTRATAIERPYCTDINFITGRHDQRPAAHERRVPRVRVRPNFNGDTSTSWTGPPAVRTGALRQLHRGNSPTSPTPATRSSLPPLTHAAEQLGDQGRDARRPRRVPVHRADAHQAQQRRHDDREAARSRKQTNNSPARRTAPARCRRTA